MTLALVLGGATITLYTSGAPVKSCVSFMNTVAKYKAMSQQRFRLLPGGAMILSRQLERIARVP